MFDQHFTVPEQKKLPQIPNHYRDLEIPERWKFTFSRKRFLLENDLGNSIVIFVTSKTLRLLASCETISSDRTFKSCPPPFEKLYWGEWKENTTGFFISQRKINLHIPQNVRHYFPKNSKIGGAHPNCKRCYWLRKGHYFGHWNKFSQMAPFRLLLSLYPGNLSKNSGIGTLASVQK